MAIDIFEAAWKNDPEGILAAVANGADVNAQHVRAGSVPLQLACSADATAAIKALLECGANPSRVFTWISRVDGREHRDKTPLMYVESCEAAQLLLNAGASVNAADGRGWTPLVCAAHAGDAKLVGLLIERGADCKARPQHAGRENTICEIIDVQMADAEKALHELPDHRITAAKERLANLLEVKALLLDSGA